MENSGAQISPVQVEIHRPDDVADIISDCAQTSFIFRNFAVGQSHFRDVTAEAAKPGRRSVFCIQKGNVHIHIDDAAVFGDQLMFPEMPGFACFKNFIKIMKYFSDVFRRRDHFVTGVLQLFAFVAQNAA